MHPSEVIRPGRHHRKTTFHPIGLDKRLVVWVAWSTMVVTLSGFVPHKR